MISQGHLRRLAVAGLIVLTGITAFEFVKHLLFPDVTIIESHTITIIFSTICAMAAALLVYRKQDMLNERLSREIDERRQTEKLLRISEEKYRDLFENANDAICIVDAELHYIDVNRKAVDMMGYSRQELLAMSISDVIPPEQKERSNDEFRKLLTTGAYANFVGKVRTKSGQMIDVEVSSSAIVANGAMVGSRDIIRNITDRKREEAERERLIAELRVALDDVKTLSGMLPICASCKKIRDDKGYWTQIEAYLHEHANAQFSHGMCPDCAKKAYEEFRQNLKSK